MKRRQLVWAKCAVVMSAVGAALLSPAMMRQAQACGGFWCSRSAPVNQAAEQIIFVDNPDDTVTAIIQISYVGPSEKFAWVIPIPGKPDIAVSSNTAFQRLDGVTAPQYTLERHVEGMCMPGQLFPNADGVSFAGAAAPPTAMTAKSAVTVIDSGSVGPYDYDVIMVDPQLSTPEQIATQWFMDHGYDLTSLDSKVLGPYLKDGLNLLAFKLTKGSQTGSIRPVILTYESKWPMIPIRPTAVAAQDNMGIKVWVDAERQAVPENYKSLVINEALINWFNYTVNYNDVVTAAADEAGGQGFVTELAGSSSAYKDAIWGPPDDAGLQMLQSQTFTDGIDAIFYANMYYRGWDGWRDAIAAATTLPAGVSIDDFGRNPDAYRGQAKVDIPKFMSELQDKVIKPVSETQRLLNSRPYLTRMYSTMSADEMTVDPSFIYNSDLADVSNKHVAQEFIECNPKIYEYDAPYRIELPQGGVVRGQGSGSWPIDDGALPANLKIVMLSAQGQGKVVEDHSGAIGEMLFKNSGTTGTGAAIPKQPADGVMIGGSQVVSMNGVPATHDMTPVTMDKASSAGSCSVGAAGAGSRAGLSAIWLLGMAALYLRRRRC